MILLFYVSCREHDNDDKTDRSVRYNALSRTIESTLQKDSIPNKIVGGHKFFERLEVKDLLAYLQLAENPGFNVS
jgi:DNA helicase-2/ATP-dependent DNA helicase PcrA